MATLLYDLDAAAAAHAKALLTEKVTRLSPAQQQGQQQTAEMLLKLRAPAYTVALDVEQVSLAIVHQMNFQLAQGIDPLFMVAASSTHAKQSDVYRDRFISPLAAQLVAEVEARHPTGDTTWGENLTSLRSHEHSDWNR